MFLSSKVFSPPRDPRMFLSLQYCLKVADSCLVQGLPCPVPLSYSVPSSARIYTDPLLLCPSTCALSLGGLWTLLGRLAVLGPPTVLCASSRRIQLHIWLSASRPLSLLVEPPASLFPVHTPPVVLRPGCVLVFFALSSGAFCALGSSSLVLGLPIFRPVANLLARLLQRI